jgi:hypothetical protein
MLDRCLCHQQPIERVAVMKRQALILRLAGVRDFATWAPLTAELVQSRRLPYGVIEVR